jgi:hypothetical protein
MRITIECPHCHYRFKVDEREDGKYVNCPECDTSMRFRLGSKDDEEVQTTRRSSHSSDIDADQEDEPTRTSSDPKRFLSLPWLMLVAVFGFLPWSEVSCASREFSFRVSQSGYQALYGGASSPFDSVEAAKDLADRKMNTDKHALAKTLERERAGFLMSCSPFMVVFWTLGLATLGWICLAPLSGLRLTVSLILVTLMIAMLLITLAVGTPLERRVAQAMNEAIRDDPDSALVMALTLTTGKTAWFWLTFVFVLLIGATEALCNLLWKSMELVKASVLFGVGSATVFGLIIGIGAQVLLWEVGLSAMESRLAQLHRAEEEKIRKAEEPQKKAEEAEKAAREKQRREERARQERQIEEERKRQKEYEDRQRLLEQEKLELEQERERERLKALEAQREKDRKERERREQLEQEAKEKAAKEAAEAERKRQEELKLEAERKADLEKRGLAYYPKPTTLHERRTAEKWHESLSHPESAKQQEAGMALKALKSEGMPFLMSELEKTKTQLEKARDGQDVAKVFKRTNFLMSFIDPEYVHFNDLSKIVACLDQKRAHDSTRMMALQYLRTRKEATKHIEQIEMLVADLKRSSKYGEEVKETLAAIKSDK